MPENNLYENTISTSKPDGCSTNVRGIQAWWSRDLCACLKTTQMIEGTEGGWVSVGGEQNVLGWAQSLLVLGAYQTPLPPSGTFQNSSWRIRCSKHHRHCHHYIATLVSLKTFLQDLSLPVVFESRGMKNTKHLFFKCLQCFQDEIKVLRTLVLFCANTPVRVKQ